MKKFTLLVAVLFFASMTFAQVSQIDKLPGKTSPQVIKNVDLKTLHHNTKGTPRWYNYGETMDLMWGGGISTLYGNNLFPDSTILVDYSGTYSAPWIHNIIDVLDAHDNDFNDALLYSDGEPIVQNSSTFNIDSISVYGIYDRNMADSIIDTLKIEVSVNNALPKYYFIGSAINSNLSADTVWIHGISYDYLTNNISLTGKKTYKFPLTPEFYADSMDNGMHEIKISTSDLTTVSAGKYVTASVQFIPGYTWTANVDTLDKMNNFFFLTMLESPGNWPMYTKRDFNISYIVPIDVRYNYADTWNGLCIPSFAYMGGADPDAYPYEHHMIYYLVNCQTNCSGVSVDELNKNSFGLGAAYPNPASLGNEIIIPFSISNTEENISLNILNPMGQILKSYSFSNYASGDYQTSVNTSGLSAGLYFYSLQTSAGKATKTFTIE
jgi:hypothetical protein